MTKPNYTHYTLILDGSGSMRPRVSEVRGSLQSLIEAHQALDGKCDLKIIKFGSRAETIFDGDIRTANAANIATLYDSTMGGTALCDTVRAAGAVLRAATLRRKTGSTITVTPSSWRRP